MDRIDVKDVPPPREYVCRTDMDWAKVIAELRVSQTAAKNIAADVGRARDHQQTGAIVSIMLGAFADALEKGLQK